MICRDVGVYTIGLKDLSFTEAIEWADINHVPFLQVRGGVRGYNLLKVTEQQLSDWKKKVEESATKIQLITTDIEMMDLLHGETSALKELNKFNLIAKLLGAKALRILGINHSLDSLNKFDFIKNYSGIDLELELHSFFLFTKETLSTLCQINSINPHLKVLLDTEQLIKYSISLNTLYQKLDIILPITNIVHCHYPPHILHQQLFNCFIDKIRKHSQIVHFCLEYYGKDAFSNQSLYKYQILCKYLQQGIC